MKSRPQLLMTAVCMVAVLLSPQSRSQDRLFTYTNQTNILSPGKAELEIWNTFRWERADFYRAFDHRIEFELGVATGLQTSFYLNLGTEAFTAYAENYAADPAGRLIITPVPVIQTRSTLSFSNEWKYKLADPVAEAVGLALYGEFTLGPQNSEIEAKVILDKMFDRFFTAFNVVGALETETIPGHMGATTSEREYELEIDYGLTYNLGNGIHAGLEAVNVNTLSSQEWEHSALFLGPTVSYAADNFWINITILPQVKGLKGATYDGLVLNERERLYTRLMFSYAL